MAPGKKRGKKKMAWIIAVVAVAAVAAAVVISRRSGNGGGDVGPTVKCERGNIVEKALAVGSIVPRNEISVKSKVSGVVQKIFKEPGEKVRMGEPLLEIRPDPTPMELAQAERAIEMDEIALKTAEKSIERSRELLGRGLISETEFDTAEKDYEQAALRLKISREHLALLEKGSVNIAGKQIESIIKAPISGFILEKSVNIGDPVVPLTSYQAGTVLMTLADMDSLLFKGTVDEIDVGKLVLHMPVEIKIGALPDKEIPGVLDKISLKAQEENNSRMFPVEISISDTQLAVLRAGYSANADIIINAAESVLTVPERVVFFSGDSTWVEVAAPDGSRRKVMVETGLSDAIRIEIRSGLDEGQDVLEKPQKKL